MLEFWYREYQPVDNFSKLWTYSKKSTEAQRRGENGGGNEKLPIKIYIVNPFSESWNLELPFLKVKYILEKIVKTPTKRLLIHHNTNVTREEFLTWPSRYAPH